jgi:hypothetical protein
MSDAPVSDAPFEDEGRQPGEMGDTSARADPTQNFQEHRPTPDELDDDDGYVPDERGVHLEQLPSEADVLEEEQELERRRSVEVPPGEDEQRRA